MPPERQSVLPPLWLHPLHTTVDGAGPTPLRPACSQSSPTHIQALIAVSKKAVESFKAPYNGSSWQQLPKHQIELGGPGFIVNALDGHDEEGPWQIPLRFSEVAHFHAITTFLIIGLRENADQQVVQSLRGPFGAVWIVGVSGAKPFERHDRTLSGLLKDASLLGAVRSDLDDAYEMAEQAIGTGGCSTVYLGRPREGAGAANTRGRLGDDEDELVAMKVWSHDPDKDTADMAMAEVGFLMAVTRHPNIIYFHGLFKFPDPAHNERTRWVMIMEYCTTGDLHDYLTAKGPCNEHRAAEIMFGLLFGLSHLHAQQIVHRDIKSENVLLTSQGRPVISDFGIATRLDDAEAMTKRCGSPGYCAPEILNSQKYCAKVDVFSAGVVLYFILSGQLPFIGPDIASVLRRTLRCRVKLDASFFGRVSLQMKALIMLLLHKEVRDRPESSAALQQLLTSYSTHLQPQALILGSYRSGLSASGAAEVREPTLDKISRPGITGNMVSASSSAPPCHANSVPQQASNRDSDEGRHTFQDSDPCTVGPSPTSHSDIGREGESWRSTGFSSLDDSDPADTGIANTLLSEIDTSRGTRSLPAGMLCDSHNQGSKHEGIVKRKGRSAQNASSPSEQVVPQKPLLPITPSSWRRRLRTSSGNSEQTKEKQATAEEAHNPRNPQEDTVPEVLSPSTPVNKPPSMPGAVVNARAQRYRFSNHEQVTEKGTQSRRLFAPLGKNRLGSMDKYKQAGKTTPKHIPATSSHSTAASSSEEPFKGVSQVDDEVDEGGDEDRRSFIKRSWESWCSDGSRNTRKSYGERRSFNTFNAGIEEEPVDEEPRDTFGLATGDGMFSDPLMEEMPSDSFKGSAIFEKMKATEKELGDSVGSSYEGDACLTEVAPSDSTRPSFQMPKFLRLQGMLNWRPGRSSVGIGNSPNNSTCLDSMGQRATYAATSRNRLDELEGMDCPTERFTSQEPSTRYADD